MTRLTTLGLVQFLAAVHIFSYQIYNARHGFFQHMAFQHWAPSWYSFLFALEGFRLTYTQLKGPSPEDMGPIIPYLLEHMVRLYSVYFVSIALLLAMPNAVSLSTAHVNAVPIFTWIGTTADGWHRAWHGGGWHISDLSFHLVSWRFVYPKLVSQSDGTCWCVLGAALGFTYLRITTHALGFATKLTMWAPYTFNHFLCGMCLAKLFVSKGMGHRGAPRDSLLLEIWPYRFAFSGILVLMAVLAIIYDGPHPNDIHSFAAPYALWLGAMMPLHLLLIWTLALEEGPLAELCRRRPFVWLGDAAYAMFVLHWNAVVYAAKLVSIMNLWPMTGKTKFAAVILPGVCVLVMLVHFLVERPLQHWTRSQHDLLYPKDE